MGVQDADTYKQLWISESLPPSQGFKANLENTVKNLLIFYTISEQNWYLGLWCVRIIYWFPFITVTWDRLGQAEISPNLPQACFLPAVCSQQHVGVLQLPVSMLL